MNEITFEQVPELFEKIGGLFVEKKEELCEMDARLGDGDLGLTMSKGFGSLPELIRAESEGAAGDIGKLLMKAGMKMSSLVPSTMGFLIVVGLLIVEDVSPEQDHVRVLLVDRVDERLHPLAVGTGVKIGNQSQPDRLLTGAASGLDRVMTHSQPVPEAGEDKAKQNDTCSQKYPF